MLHVTNGDSAAEAIQATGIDGPILPWRDVLHDGPVPAGLSADQFRSVRADFLAGRGWDARDAILRSLEERDAALADSVRHDEVVLWFEHDLYDQLQLLQVLERLSDRRVRVSLINPAQYLGMATPEQLRALFALRAPVTDAQRGVAAAAWDAFRSRDPRAIEAVLATDLSPLPHLAAALRRHLAEFPSVRDGLSQSERQALEALADGPLSAIRAFRRAHHDREDPIFLGDASFYALLEGLSPPSGPLVAFEDGSPVRAEPSGEGQPLPERAIVLTERGRAVLAGREDRVRGAGIDRWLGGVHLTGHEADWRWDADAARLHPARAVA